MDIIRVIINISADTCKPYKDFADLMENGSPDFSMVEKLRGKMDELNHRRELKQAIYGENVDLGDDNVMKSNFRTMTKRQSTSFRYPALYMVIMISAHRKNR